MAVLWAIPNVSHPLSFLISGIASIPAKVGEVVETIPDKLGAFADSVLANEKTVVEEEDAEPQVVEEGVEPRVEEEDAQPRNPKLLIL